MFRQKSKLHASVPASMETCIQRGIWRRFELVEYAWLPCTRGRQAMLGYDGC